MQRGVAENGNRVDRCDYCFDQAIFNDANVLVTVSFVGGCLTADANDADNSTGRNLGVTFITVPSTVYCNS